MLSNGTHNVHVLQRNARGYVNKKEIHKKRKKSRLPAIDNLVYVLCIDCWLKNSTLFFEQFMCEPK